MFLLFMAKKTDVEKIEGVVIEALPNTSFRVRLQDESMVLAYLSGKMRMYRIRILVGDRVEMERIPGDERARIVYRHKQG